MHLNLKAFLPVLFLVLQGCIFVPAIDSVSRLGVTRSDRERLLAEQIKKFQEVLFWGNPNEALRFARDDARDDVRRYLKQISQEERVVESKVKSIDFSGNSYAAEVEVGVKYYRVPYYLVNERFENQKWEFSTVGGWKIVAIGGSPQG